MQPLFDKVLLLDRAILSAQRRNDVRKATQFKKELATVLEAIARHYIELYTTTEPDSEVMPAEPNMGALSKQDRIQLDYLIAHIRAMNDTGVFGNELVQMSRVMRRHIEAGYRLPAYMAERGIRLRKTPKGWKYIHEDWDF